MKINIKADMKAAQKVLGALKKQVAFAASVAINKTATDIQKVERSAIRRELENPTPSVVKSIRVNRSNKRNLTASVYVLPVINNFLRYQIVGGTRPPRGKAEAVPVNIKLNKYGNVPGRRQGKLRKLLARPDTFNATIKGVAGIYQRGKGKNNRSITLLAGYEPSVRYSKRFYFYTHAGRTVAARWSRNFRQSIRAAIRTAR
jgi:hypothetical protein